MNQFNDNLPAICQETQAEIFMELDQPSVTAGIQETMLAHLKSCEACEQYRTDTVRLLAALEKTDPASAPAALANSIWQAIEAEPLPLPPTNKVLTFPSLVELLKYQVLMFIFLGLLTGLSFLGLIHREQTMIRDTYNERVEATGTLGHGGTTQEEALIALISDVATLPELTNRNLKPLLHDNVMQPFELDLVNFDILIAQQQFRWLSLAFPAQKTDLPADHSESL